MMTIPAGILIFSLMLSIFLVNRFKKVANKYIRQSIAIANGMVSTISAYSLTSLIIDCKYIAIIIISLLLIINLIILMRMIGMKLTCRRMKRNDFAITFIFMAAILYPLRKAEFSIFSYQWQVVLVNLFMYAISSVSEEVAFRLCFVKSFIGEDRLDQIVEKGPNKFEVLGFLVISVIFALLHFDFSVQLLYSRIFFSISCILILISTRRVSLIIILHFFTNILI